MAAVLRRRVEDECRPGAVDDLTTAGAFEGEEPVFTVSVGSTTLRLPRSGVVALVEAARRGDGSYRERRDRFRSRLVDLLLQELVAVAPRRSRDATIRRDLERNRRVERLLERVWPSPGAREALRTLYDSPDLLRACSDGVLDDAERAALHRPRSAAAADEPWTLDDHVCLEELRHLIDGETPRRYGHIVIDEAQDLTPMQARALRRRCAAGGSMTVLGDLAQSTGPHAYADWDRLGTLLSDHGDWKVETLGTSYRVPSEVMGFVAPLARVAGPDVPVPAAVRAAGEGAVTTVATDAARLLADAEAQVRRLLGSDDGRTLRSVAVVVPDTDSALFDGITARLAALPDVGDDERGAVSVLTAAQVKGMEYDHVLVVEPSAIADGGPVGLRRLYVALTRSTQSLTVLHTAPLPEALLPGDGGGDAHEADLGPAAATARPEIGTDVRVRVLGHTGGGHYKVEAVQPRLERPLLLAVRHGSAPPPVGSLLDTWVLRHTSAVSFVTVDGRGRQPISPRMSVRYLAALDVPALLAAGTVPDDARTRLSELKGMANRCLRLDQQDWLDVWRLLGSPDRERLAALRDLAGEAGRAVSSGAFDTAAFRSVWEASGWPDALLAARRDLERRAADASGGSGESGATPAPPAVSTPQDTATTVVAEPEPKDQPMPVISADVTAPAAEPDATDPVDASASLRELLGSEAAADRTCHRHESVRHRLLSRLHDAGLSPVSDPIVDVRVTADSGLCVLFEVLGEGRTTYADLRAGASRLREIDSARSLTADRHCLVLSGPPAEPWSVEAARDSHGIDVVWLTPDGSWEGAGADGVPGLG